MTQSGNPLLVCPACRSSKITTTTFYPEKINKKTGVKTKIKTKEVRWVCECGEIVKRFREDKYGKRTEYVLKTKKSESKDARGRA